MKSENPTDCSGVLDAVASAANLEAAWAHVRARDGAPGVDGLRVFDFESQAPAELLALSEELREGTYRPKAARRIVLPDDPGRPIAVSTVRDRIVQRALAQVLADLLDGYLSPCAFAYRPGRSVRQALQAVDREIRAGSHWVVRTDISRFFDRIDRTRLSCQLKDFGVPEDVMRIVHRLLKTGAVVGMTAIDAGRGTPQGSSLSPLLSNLFLVPVDEAVRAAGFPYFRYGDDVLLLAPTAEQAANGLDLLATEVGRLGLELSSRKTCRTHVSAGFEYLGARFDSGGGQPTRKACAAFEDGASAAVAGGELPAALAVGWQSWYGRPEPEAIASYASLCAWVGAAAQHGDRERIVALAVVRVMLPPCGAPASATVSMACCWAEVDHPACRVALLLDARAALERGAARSEGDARRLRFALGLGPTELDVLAPGPGHTGASRAAVVRPAFAATTGSGYCDRSAAGGDTGRPGAYAGAGEDDIASQDIWRHWARTLGAVGCRRLAEAARRLATGQPWPGGAGGVDRGTGTSAAETGLRRLSTREGPGPELAVRRPFPRYSGPERPSGECPFPERSGPGRSNREYPVPERWSGESSGPERPSPERSPGTEHSGPEASCFERAESEGPIHELPCAGRDGAFGATMSPVATAPLRQHGSRLAGESPGCTKAHAHAEPSSLVWVTGPPSRPDVAAAAAEEEDQDQEDQDQEERDQEEQDQEQRDPEQWQGTPPGDGEPVRKHRDRSKSKRSRGRQPAGHGPAEGRAGGPGCASGSRAAPSPPQSRAGASPGPDGVQSPPSLVAALLGERFVGRDDICYVERRDRRGHRRFVLLDEPLGPERLQEHAQGGTRLGTPVFRSDGFVGFGMVAVWVRRAAAMPPWVVGADAAPLRLRWEVLVARAHDYATAWCRAAEGVGLRPVLEDTGDGGRRVWVLLDRWLPARLVRRLLLRLAEQVGRPPDDLAVEQTPYRDAPGWASGPSGGDSRAGTTTGRHGNTQARGQGACSGRGTGGSRHGAEQVGRPPRPGPFVVLPFGREPRTGASSRLVDRSGAPLSPGIETCPLSDARVVEAFVRVGPLASCTVAEVELALGEGLRPWPAALAVLRGCGVIDAMARKARLLRVVDWPERTTMLEVLAHLPEREVPGALAFLLEPTGSDEQDVRRHLKHVGGFPLSCARIRARLPRLCEGACRRCRFEPLPFWAYPSPLLHGVRPWHVPALKDRARQHARRSKGRAAASAGAGAGPGAGARPAEGEGAGWGPGAGARPAGGVGAGAGPGAGAQPAGGAGAGAGERPAAGVDARVVAGVGVGGGRGTGAGAAAWAGAGAEAAGVAGARAGGEGGAGERGYPAAGPGLSGGRAAQGSENASGEWASPPGEQRDDVPGPGAAGRRSERLLEPGAGLPDPRAAERPQDGARERSGERGDEGTGEGHDDVPDGRRAEGSEERSREPAGIRCGHSKGRPVLPGKVREARELASRLRRQRDQVENALRGLQRTEELLDTLFAELGWERVRLDDGWLVRDPGPPRVFVLVGRDPAP